MNRKLLMILMMVKNKGERLVTMKRPNECVNLDTLQKPPPETGSGWTIHLEPHLCFQGILKHL